MHKNQKGFSLVEIMLVLIFVTLIVFVGWYVWDSNKKTDQSLKSADKSSELSSAVTSDGKYLIIKEKGLKFELTEKIKDATYRLSKDGYAYISLKRYESMKGLEGCSIKGDGSLAALSYAKPGDDNAGSPYTEDELKLNGYSTKVDGTYYWLTPASQSFCFDIDTVSESDPRVQEMYDLRGELVAQGKTITKTD